MPTAPYISMVVAARNDNHGGNMLGRMQACLDSWMFQAQRYDLRVDFSQPQPANSPVPRSSAALGNTTVTPGAW